MLATRLVAEKIIELAQRGRFCDSITDRRGFQVRGSPMLVQTHQPHVLGRMQRYRCPKKANVGDKREWGLAVLGHAFAACFE
jgi:hypothetical protein